MVTCFNTIERGLAQKRTPPKKPPPPPPRSYKKIKRGPFPPWGKKKHPGPGKKKKNSDSERNTTRTLPKKGFIEKGTSSERPLPHGPYPKKGKPGEKTSRATEKKV